MRRFFCLMAALGLWAGLSLPASALTVTPVNAARLKRVVASHRGHVVLVNFWATWCTSCVKEFPGLVRISRQYRGKGLVVIAVSGDIPKDIGPRVKPFLARVHAAFPQYIIHDDLDTFVDGFQKQWQADFPQTFVFDKRGRLARELRGDQTVADWRAAVVPLLNK